jgi:hypothetical protein
MELFVPLILIPLRRESEMDEVSTTLYPAGSGA